MQGTQINVQTLFGVAKIRVTIDLPRGRAEITLSEIDATELIADLSRSIADVSALQREKIILMKSEIDIARSIADDYRTELNTLKAAAE